MSILYEVVINFIAYLKIYTSRFPTILCVSFAIYILEYLVISLSRSEWKIPRREEFTRFFLFAVSLSLIYTLTLHGRSIDLTKTNLTFAPFASYAQAAANPEIFLQIVMNIFLFLPFGFCLPWNFPYFRKNRRILFLAICLSGGIELLQGLTGMGLFEIDDIFHNIVGIEAGAVLYTAASWIWRKWKRRIKKGNVKRHRQSKIHKIQKYNS